MPESEQTPARREALIVAADAYEDPKLRSLRAPARDAEALARVLGDPEVGDFRVSTSLNEPDHVVRRKLSEFFRNRTRDDLLLLHVACHGLKDEDGTLYFASSNTAVDHLEATAIPSEFVNNQMTKSRSRRVVLLLDCCFGGAFARGLVHRAGDSVEIKEEFEGQGRVVLTASRAMEYAFEGDNLEGDAQPSIFTSAVVHGLESGEADRDGDSRVSVDELYDYVYDRVRETTPNQTPSKWTFDVHGDLYLARSPFREPEPAPLPVELRAAMESPFANVRAGAAEELAGLLAGTDVGLAAAARIALEELVDDDSKRVSEAAAQALAADRSASQPVAVVLDPTGTEEVREQRPAPTPPRPPPSERTQSTTSLVAMTLARASRRQDGLALVGAALLVFGYFTAAGWTTAWSFATHVDEIWFVWSPAEAFGAALLAAGAVLATRRGRLTHEAADGLLLGVGLLILPAMAALVRSVDFEFGGTAQLTAVGAIAIATAGALGVLTRRGREVSSSRRATSLAAAGAALVLSPLFVNLDKDWSLLQTGWGGPYYAEVVVAGLVAVVALLLLARVPRARLHAAGALIAVGLLMALHFVGFMIQTRHYGGGVGAISLGGPLGVLGGLLLVAAGASFLVAERPTEALSPQATAPT
jgi:hypothetical protein